MAETIFSGMGNGFQQMPPASPSIAVYVEYPAGVWLLPFSARELRGILLAMAQKAGELARPLCGIDLHIVDDAAIAQANREYMDCMGPTNILSFPSADAMPGILLFSADAFFRELMLYRQPAGSWLLCLLAHGVGHLAGFEHSSKMDIFAEECRKAAEKSLAAAKK